MRLKLYPFKKNEIDTNIKHVRKIYSHIDRRIEAFKKQTGIRCKTGCGHCCENPHVYTTVIEMMPAAKKLWDSGRALQIIDQLDKMDTPSRCVFYQPSACIPGNGRCTIYPYRASICRLFGFSVKRDKNNRPALVTCAIIKKLYPQAVENINSVCMPIQPPSISGLARKLSCIDPYRGTEQVPVNQAIKIALEKSGFMLQLKYNDKMHIRFARIYNTIRYGAVWIFKQLEIALFGKFRIKRGF